MAQHQKTMPKSEAGYTCAVGTGAKVTGACNEGESIYGHLEIHPVEVILLEVVCATGRPSKKVQRREGGSAPRVIKLGACRDRSDCRIRPQLTREPVVARHYSTSSL